VACEGCRPACGGQGRRTQPLAVCAGMPLFTPVFSQSIHPSPAATLPPVPPSHPQPQQCPPHRLTASPQGHGGHQQQQADCQQPHSDAPPPGPAPCKTQPTTGITGELGNPSQPPDRIVMAQVAPCGCFLFKNKSQSTPKQHPLPAPGPPPVSWAPDGHSPGLGWAPSPSPSCPAGAGCTFS